MHSLLSITFTLICVLGSVLQPQKAHAKIRIVATLPDYGALAQSLGGEHVSVHVLARPEENPHYVDPKPSYIVALHRADLLISNGLGLEIGWLPPLVVQARNRDILPGHPGRFVAASHLQEIRGIPQGIVDRSQGDIHPSGNPHFYYSLHAMQNIAAALVQRFIAIEPEHKSFFYSRLEVWKKRSEALLNQSTKRFASLKNKRIVTYHPSFLYLLHDLGLQTAINIEPQAGIAPSPSHLERVLKTMQAENIQVIVQEEFYPTSATRTLAQLSKGKLVEVQAGARFADSQTYLQRFEHLSNQLYQALQP